MSQSWGYTASGDADTLTDLLRQAADEHFATTTMNLRGMRGRLEQVDPKDDVERTVLDRELATLDGLEQSLVCCREQSDAAIQAAMVLVAAQHINPATVSLTGDANPDHAPEGGVNARTTISVVRA